MLVWAEHGSLGLLLHYKFRVHLVLKFTGFLVFWEVLVLVFHSVLHPNLYVICNWKETQVIYFYMYAK